MVKKNILNELNYRWHDDVIKWKHLPRYWPFVRRIHWSPVNSPHKGQWSGALKFSLICVWIKSWVNSREAGDLRCYRAHYDVTVMVPSHYLNQHWNIVNWTPRKKIQWNYNRNSCIFIHKNPFEIVVWKMTAILSRPQCVNGWVVFLYSLWCVSLHLASSHPNLLHCLWSFQQF